jgi:hypothetical protein
MRKGPVPDVAARIAALDADDEFDFMAHGGENNDDAGHFFVIVMSPSPLKPWRLGFVSIGLPLSWTARNKPGTFRDLVLAWCRLSPFHGYARQAVLRNPEYGRARRAEPFCLSASCSVSPAWNSINPWTTLSTARMGSKALTG